MKNKNRKADPKRDFNIFKDWESGLKQKQLADKNNLNISRISKILKRFNPTSSRRVYEKYPNQKLMNPDVVKIYEMRIEGFTLETIAAIMNVSRSTVTRNLRKYRSWDQESNKIFFKD